MRTRFKIPGDPTTSLVVFMDGVNKNVPNSDCWHWELGRGEGGYGQFYKGRTFLAHRVSWELHNGRPIPPGKVVCHRCDNPPCVNPAHLFIGSQKDNIRDMVRKGRKNPARGERNGSAKLNASQVMEMRKLAGTMSAHSLGAKFGVSCRTALDILYFKKWKHIPA